VFSFSLAAYLLTKSALVCLTSQVGVPQAWSQCDELGMSLLSIESSTEFWDLITYLRDNGEKIAFVKIVAVHCDFG
jgi:hypothetical protein